MTQNLQKAIILHTLEVQVGATLYTFWDNPTHYKTKSVHLLGASELNN